MMANRTTGWGLRSCAATLALCLLAAACVAQEEVTIRNQDMEETDAANGTPAGWVYIPPLEGDGYLTVAPGRDGGQAAQVTCTRRAAGWGPGVGQVGEVSVKGDQWYELSFWAKGHGLINGVIVGLRDTTNWEANRLWRVVYPGPTWRQFRLKFYADQALSADVSRLQFSFDSTGTLWVDDVRLVTSDPERTWHVLEVAGRHNRLCNSSFELGTAGWATWGVDELYGEIDRTTAVHGKCSFRITLARHRLPVHFNDFTYVLRSRAGHETVRSLPLCPVGYLPVNQDAPLTFSFYARGSRAGLPVLAQVFEDSGRCGAETFKTSLDWERHSFTVIPQSNTAFVTVGLDGSADLPLPATLWLDALQVEMGSAATPYEPAFPVEASLKTGREGNVYTLGESVKPALHLHSYIEAPVTVTASVDVEDFRGQRRRAYQESLEVPPHQQRTVPLELGITQPGFYRLHLSLAGDDWRTAQSVRSAVIRPVDPTANGLEGYLGLNHAFVSDLYMRRVAAMGVSWVRSWFCKWEDVETTPGAFDFGEAQLQWERLDRLGMKVLLCLSDPSSEWASTAPVDLTGTTSGEAQSQRVWWLPRSLDDYEVYVRTVAQQFVGKVWHYEVFNEPTAAKGGEGCNLDLDRTYPQFLERARRAIRSASPDNRLLGASFDYFGPLADLSAMVAAMDILSEHRYPRLAPTAGMLEDMAGVHERLRAADGDRPIWVTEYGLYADDDPDPTTLHSGFLEHYGSHSEQLAAMAVARHHIALLASGVEKVFTHIGNWPFTVNWEHGCGFHPFFEWGGAPRKTYVALNALATLIPAGSRHVKTWPTAAGVFAFRFDGPNGTTFALWSESGSEVPHSLAAEVAAAGTELYDVCGARLPALPTTLDDAPVYARAANATQVGVMQTALDQLTAATANGLGEHSF